MERILFIDMIIKTIGIIDADLIGRKKHRFPNLACEKISAYWKEQSAEVKLLLSYEDLDKYSRVYISKVFTDTPVNKNLTKLIETSQLPDNIFIGGTGFYFDKAPALPDEIEHHMPDYHLYDEWIESEVQLAQSKYKKQGRKFNEKSFRVQFKEYTDYSIGFMTRGCFRKCPFCVNQKYNKVFLHSPLEEFFDSSRKKICLLDDNVLGCREWKDIILQLQETNKPFKFKQGLDERILTDEKCDLLFQSKYDADYTFAFDNIDDYPIIEKKLKLMQHYIQKYHVTNNIKFYVLVGFESIDIEDIKNMWKRISLIMDYKCIPYIMRYQSKDGAPWQKSEHRDMYITAARWCNQPSLIKKKSFREFADLVQSAIKTPGFKSVPIRLIERYEKDYPEIANMYFDKKF